MTETTRKLFGLFRSKISSDNRPAESKEGPSHHSQRSHHREGGTFAENSRRNPQRRRRPPGLKPVDGDAVQARESACVDSTVSRTWPPLGYTAEDELSPQKAAELITQGVPVFKGSRVSIPHASDDYFALYAICAVGPDNEGDETKFYKSAFEAATYQLQGPGLASHPWDCLEQPSMAFCYGNRPGTITLNHWASLCGQLKPIIELRDPGVKPRDVGLSTIIDRLIFLEGGFEEDYPDLMYKNLYRLVKDPDRFLAPHKGTEKQIADLIVVLSGRQWIDFSDPRNQIVAKFFFNASFADERRYKVFFYQLLLSMELDARINSRQHADLPKQKLLSQLPPSIAWNLALARRWRESMSIERYKEGDDSKQIKFRLLLKKKQAKALLKFAQALRWPNFRAVEEILKSKDHEAGPVEARSSDTMSFFTGVILPGTTLPWVLMNSLIDCDGDSGQELASLTHMFPSSGFQYRGVSYWSSTCVVGKVLAPTCREMAGWVGPVIPSTDLNRIQIARIRQRSSRQRISAKEVQSMSIRSDPIGPPSDTYPVVEYQLLQPDLEENSNAVRIERLSLERANLSSSNSQPEFSPEVYDACIQFAIDGRSWPLRLSFDVSFISACPCIDGPHPLFYDYIYKAVKVDEVLTIKDWGGLTGGPTPIDSSGCSTDRGQKSENIQDDNEIERVLVIEAFGVPDNEVLGRAWCCHWGLSAVIANIKKTCMACAIREAYAACLNVVILIVKDPDHDNDV